MITRSVISSDSTLAASADAGVASGSATPAFSPLYQQIKVLILQSLQSGEWKPSTAIPSEQELAVRFKVSQGTVRKAIDELAAENLLVRRQGKGTFVATHAEQHVQYRFLKLFPDNGDPSSKGPAQREIIDCKRMRASADVARALGLHSGDAVLQVRRVLSFAGIPAPAKPPLPRRCSLKRKPLRGAEASARAIPKAIILLWNNNADTPSLHPCSTVPGKIPKSIFSIRRVWTTLQEKW